VDAFEFVLRIAQSVAQGDGVVEIGFVSACPYTLVHRQHLVEIIKRLLIVSKGHKKKANPLAKIGFKNDA
jgi:hypothetical protein